MAQSESATKEQLPELVERFGAWASLVDLAGYYCVDAETISRALERVGVVRRAAGQRPTKAN